MIAWTYAYPLTQVSGSGKAPYLNLGQTHTKVHISTNANSDRFIANGLIN